MTADKAIDTTPALLAALVGARQQRGWSQAALAKRLGTSQAAMCTRESGCRNVTLVDLMRWLRELGAALVLTWPGALEPPKAPSVDAEPPVGSVVAIDWGQGRQEIWVSNRANVGNWYTTDVPLDLRDGHPQWHDVCRRAEGRALTLLVAGADDVYRAGFRSGVDAVSTRIESAVDEIRHSR